MHEEAFPESLALIESVLKPEHVQPSPEDPQFNYIEDITARWFRSCFYFTAIYRSAGPYALDGTFEAKFARLEYIGDARFNLAAQHHTGEWIEVFPDLSLDECLEVRDDPWFHP